jgi:MFS family permease
MPNRTRLPGTIVVFGAVSLLNDFAAEMVAPLIPLLLATALGAGPVVLGIVEGTANAISNLLKLWAGRHSDRTGRRRKPYVLLGYALSNVVRPLIAVSGSWSTILAIRITDRIGKGIRTAPRDALAADAVTPINAGRAFGFMRALDHSGAVCGALVAAAIVYYGTDKLEIVIALSAIPGIATLGLIAFGVRESPRPHAHTDTAAPLRWSSLHAQTRAYLFILGIFALGRIPEAFLLLRGHELGMGVVELLLMWAAMHVVKAVVSESTGRFTDRLGRRPFILAGWAIYVVTLFGLAAIGAPWELWIASAGLGFYFGLTEGAERALIRDFAGASEYGTAYGWYHMIVGLAAIPAGLMLGGLWSLHHASTAFAASGAFALVALLVFWRTVGRAR